MSNNRRTRRSIAYALLGALGILICSSCTADNATVCENSVRRGETLQAAIDRTPTDGVLCLPIGVWEENVRISKSITLRGLGREQSVIKGTMPGYPVVWVEGVPGGQRIVVTLHGVRITEAVGDECAEFLYQMGREICPYGVLVQGSAHVSIVDCDVSANRSGIAAYSFSEIRVERSIITGNDWEGIYLTDSVRAEIRHSEITENGFAGIGIALFAVVEVSGCTVSANHGDGIGVVESAVADITDNTISDNGWAGIKMSQGAEVSIQSNRVLANGEFGIAQLNMACYEENTPFLGTILGADNWVPEAAQTDGNQRGALCPPLVSDEWPVGFLAESDPGS